MSFIYWNLLCWVSGNLYAFSIPMENIRSRSCRE